MVELYSPYLEQSKDPDLLVEHILPYRFHGLRLVVQWDHGPLASIRTEGHDRRIPLAPLNW